MRDLLPRLTSRKLWLAVGAFITFVANGQYTEAMGVVLAYIGMEGAADIKSQAGGSYVAETLDQALEDDTPNTGRLVTGRFKAPLEEDQE